jgi:tetratricopeptide (TPR) repeat protein
LLQNYRTAFLQVAEYYARERQMDKVKYLMEEMEKRVPGSVIAWTNPYLRLIRDSYSIAVDTSTTKDILQQNYSERDLMTIGENLYRLQKMDAAEQIFSRLFESNPENIQALSMLINILERNKRYEKGVAYLESWLENNPRDTQARMKLEFFKSQL